jgi:hypothetical protein
VLDTVNGFAVTVHTDFGNRVKARFCAIAVTLNTSQNSEYLLLGQNALALKLHEQAFVKVIASMVISQVVIRLVKVGLCGHDFPFQLERPNCTTAGTGFP